MKKTGSLDAFPAGFSPNKPLPQDMIVLVSFFPMS